MYLANFYAMVFGAVLRRTCTAERPTSSKDSLGRTEGHKLAMYQIRVQLQAYQIELGK